jgi:hypothetical protein
MEIGFGMGGASAHIAAQHPEDTFLCCEMRESGVDALLKLAVELGLETASCGTTRWRVVAEPDTVLKPVDMFVRQVIASLLHLPQRRHLVGVSNLTIKQS